MKPTFVYEALSWASSFLAERGRETRAAEILMKHRLGVSNWTEFHFMRREKLPEGVWETYYEDIVAHSTGVPIQHRTGVEEFFGRTFHVSSDVLIPRPETEELVNGVIEWGRQRQHPLTVCDIGTGSGAIAVTLALELRGVSVTAVDINEAALDTAKSNASLHGASVTFLQGDLVQPILQQNKRFDVIVSNPPYIPKADWEQLDTLVKDHEPELALIGSDDDGLYCYRAIADKLPRVLKENGLAAFEVGENQAEQTAKILKEALPQAAVNIYRDINGKERMVFCERRA
ncbi:release factor glutamine methyltransferase [Alteribacillus persepolensis]|uniref:Release factor glutamine methyltransferase n=1 Tax=Alteribacillus persepolensis TaxID=568899 RepID=A0A1G8HD52_9BACI|nr:peptide chain release factor N(5)-glutamine methyltransferase [Alteribacillus persepolensis]SDI04529.1 release factor glutamine methyltransferase [Alteribacillus persepolensis]